jgi:quinolinate synthase
MKLNTLEKLLACLEDLEPRVTVPEAIAKKARLAIQRMLEISDPGGHARKVEPKSPVD